MHVWVIEMLIAKRWKPTLGHGLTKNAANIKVDIWREIDRRLTAGPYTKYRLKKYIPVPIDDRPVGHLKPF